MIFGLFKKEECADVIFTGGRIYTMDADAPWAEAVACKDGKILAVGDAETISDLQGDDTEIVDLEEGVLLPGFIDVSGHPVLQSFNDVCLVIYDDMTMDEILSALKDYIAANPDYPHYFAYGFNSEIMASMDKDATQALLDHICSDKPVALLDICGVQGWFNSASIEVVKESVANEENMPMITIPYMMSALSPVDFVTLQEKAIEISKEYCQKGYTTVFDCGAPDYLHSIYQDILVEMLQEDMLKQRFLGSLLVTRNLEVDYLIKKLLQKRTSCGEINEFINFNTLKIVIDSEGEDKFSVSPDMLKIAAIQASDKGFDLHIDAVGKTAIADAFEAVFLARAAGYRKNHFTLAHSFGLSQEEKTELLLDNELCETVSTLGDFMKKYRGIESAKDVRDAIDKLTIDAAIQLGISDDYGSIEAEKKADFVIFKENPLDCNLPRFRSLTATKTVIDGKVVYDADEDDAADWMALLSTQQF